MEAVCPQCQMRYEVSQELLDQASPVLCPSCQVELELVQAESAPPVAEQAPAGPAASEPTVQPPAEPAQEAAVDLGGWGQPAQAPGPTYAPMAEPTAPAPVVPETAADAWGTAPTWDDAAQPDRSQGESPSEPQVEPAAGPSVESAAEPAPESAAEPAPESAPEPAPESAPETASEPAPGPAAAPAIPGPETEQKPQLITEPEGPKNSWDAGELLWGDSAEGTDIGIQPPDAPPAADQPPAQVEPAPAAPPPIQPPPPAPPSQAPIVPEQAPAPPEQPPAAPAQPAEVQPPAAGPPPAASGDAVLTGSAPVPVAGMDDWASAAAKWAASGFSTDNMPEFVKGRDGAQGQEQAAAPVDAAAPPQQTQPPVAAPPPMPAPESEPPPAELPEDALQPLPAEPAPPAPPPLPNQQKKALDLPSPAEPPPLGGQRRSSYVMRGSGEGVKEEMPPWMGDSEPPPPSGQPSTVASMAVPTSAPTAPVQPAPSEPALPLPSAKPAKSSALGKVLIVVAVLALVAVGGYAAWYFYQASQKVSEDMPGLTHEPAESGGELDAGAATAPATDAGPKVEEPGKGPKKGPDKGKGPGAGKPHAKPGPGTKPAPGVADKPKTPATKVAKSMRAVAAAHVKKGNELLRQKRVKEAIRYFNKALKADKTLVLAHRSLGVAYAQLGENRKACREYRIYLKSLSPGHKEIPALEKILEGCK